MQAEDRSARQGYYIHAAGPPLFSTLVAFRRWPAACSDWVRCAISPGGARLGRSRAAARRVPAQPAGAPRRAAGGLPDGRPARRRRGGSSRDEVPVGYAAALRSTEFGVLWFVFAILVLSSVHAGVRGPAAATRSRRARSGARDGLRGGGGHRGRVAARLAVVALELDRGPHREAWGMAARGGPVHARHPRRRTRVAGATAAQPGPPAGVDRTRGRRGHRRAVRDS